MGELYPISIAESRPVSVVGMAVAFTIWFLVFVAATLVPILVVPVLLVIFLGRHAELRALSAGGTIREEKPLVLAALIDLASPPA
jgi:hypothetical protein